MILGISVNSRILGMAALHDGTLTDYRIRLFKEHWKPEKLNDVINCIRQSIEEYGAKTLALLEPHRHYSNPETKILHAQIQLLCKQLDLPLHVYTAKHLNSLSENTRTKKKALMQALTLLYPELSLAQKRELTNKTHYYNKLFEAVGVATLHQRRLHAL